MKSRQPRILLWDIETSHMILAAFQLFNPGYIPYQNILQDWFIFTMAYKFLGQKKVYSFHIDKPGNDKEIVKKMHKILSNVDLIVGHNGDKFDYKKFNARAIYWGLDPIPDMKQDDTLKMARKKFKCSSHRLDYLGNFLGVGEKMHTKEGLWLRALDGDKKAIKEMEQYNKQDVLLLERVYLKLRPWCGSNLNWNALVGTKARCPACGGLDHISNGYGVKGFKAVPRLQCKACKRTFPKPKQ